MILKIIMNLYVEIKMKMVVMIALVAQMICQMMALILMGMVEATVML